VAEKLDPKEIVTFEELLKSNVYTQGALINLLEKKGIIDKKELLEEINRLRREQKIVLNSPVFQKGKESI
jgi:hypothetical protein